MTTIAYRDGVLAADTATWINDGNVRCPGRTGKLRRLSDGSLYSGAGASAQIEEFGNWLESGCKGDKPKADDISVLHIRLDGTIVLYAGELERVAGEAPFYAVGSGASAALGAMMAGASAAEAVRIAMEVDPYTAGEVDVLHLAAERTPA